jgi:3-(3-hydroxy-phenyl)propionate hydroxylase
MSESLIDVAIIGFGPAGATLANLLGQTGLNVVVLEKEAAIYPLPRAIHFDGEVMRIFQSIGLRREVEGISRAGLKGMHFVNAEGETLLIRGGTTAMGPHGCASNYYFHQPELERVLREGVQRFENVRICLQHSVLDIKQQPDHACLQVQDSSNDTTYEINARYVVGCDGAHALWFAKSWVRPCKTLACTKRGWYLTPCSKTTPRHCLTIQCSIATQPDP